MMFFWILIALIIGWMIGWEIAHKNIAEECRRLGGFYVGDTNFRCTAIKQESLAIPPPPPFPNIHHDQEEG